MERWMGLGLLMEPARPPAGREAPDISGTYAASVGGVECVLRLWFNGAGFVSGSFAADGETLEVRGGCSGRTGAMHGFLLEPFGHLPVAMFKAQATAAGLSLCVGVLEFDALAEAGDAERIEFSRVWGAEG